MQMTGMKTFCLLALLVVFSIFLGANTYANERITPSPTPTPALISLEPPLNPMGDALLTEKNIVAQNISVKSGKAQVSGKYPAFEGLNNTFRQLALNASIDEFVESKTEDLPDKVKRVEFSYELKSTDEVMTVIIYCVKHSDIAEKSCNILNVNVITLEQVTITDVGGPNIVKILNKVIANDAKRSPGKYNSVLNAVDGNRNYYVEDNSIVVVFDDLEVSPRKDELFRLKISLDQLVNSYVKKDDYRTAAGSKVQMIMLKMVSDNFGYDIMWVSDGQKVEISKNQNVMALIYIGQNSYGLGKNAKKKLEAPPEIFRDRTYLPVTFFSDILGMAVNMDDDGTICISEYQD